MNTQNNSGLQEPVVQSSRPRCEATPDWEKAFAHVVERGCHISHFRDGWAVSFMYSRKMWRRGFRSIGAARRSITAAHKRLSKLGAASNLNKIDENTAEFNPNKKQ